MESSSSGAHAKTNSQANKHARTWCRYISLLRSKFGKVQTVQSETIRATLYWCTKRTLKSWPSAELTTHTWPWRNLAVSVINPHRENCDLTLTERWHCFNKYSEPPNSFSVTSLPLHVKVERFLKTLTGKRKQIRGERKSKARVRAL